MINKTVHIHIITNYDKRQNKGVGVYYLEYKSALIKRVIEFTNAYSLRTVTLVTIILALNRFTEESKIYIHTKDKVNLEDRYKYSDKELEALVKMNYKIFNGGHEVKFLEDLDLDLLKAWDEKYLGTDNNSNNNESKSSFNIENLATDSEEVAKTVNDLFSDIIN